MLGSGVLKIHGEPEKTFFGDDKHSSLVSCRALTKEVLLDSSNWLLQKKVIFHKFVLATIFLSFSS